MDRLGSLVSFYKLLDQLEQRLGSPRLLSQCNGRLGWPKRGVYFFLEPGEERSDSGKGHRVVRVGTHALFAGAKSTLWQRLSQHRGTYRNPGGNHRCSIFRGHVGRALLAQRGEPPMPHWNIKGHLRHAAHLSGMTAEQLHALEHPLEVSVSRHIGSMPFLWVDVPDAPGENSVRGVIERGAITLLSNCQKSPLDPPSPDWLGRHSETESVRASGLWNRNHVHQAYDPGFLIALGECIESTVALSPMKPKASAIPPV